MKTFILKVQKAKILLAVGITATILAGCTNLDESPYTFTDPKNYYKNETELSSSLNSVYNGFRKMASDYKYLMKIECSTHLGQPSYTKENAHLINVWSDVNNASNSVSELWSRAYATINRANIVLGRGEGVEMDPAAKERIFAQARFLRGYAYFHLLRIYGGCPIPESFTSEETAPSALNIPRKSVDEVYTYLIEDLKYGIGKLPKKGEAGYDNWRVTEGACYAALGEVYLYRASMNNNNEEYLTLSKEYSWKLIDPASDGHKYELVKPYRNLWYWFNADAKNGKESIFELQFAPIQDQDCELHRQFGINVTESNLGSYMYHRFGPSTYAYLSYDDADNRKDCFLTEYVESKTGNTIVFHPEDKGVWPGSHVGNVNGWPTSTPGNVKYYDRITDASLQKPAPNFYILRYSEVLLNYAEAANLLTPGQGVEQFNEVRERAGLAPITGISGQALDDAIFEERCKEFIGEGKVYFDALRTDRLGTLVNEFIKRGVLEKLYLFEPLQFAPKKGFLWKIPQGDYDSNPALSGEQNPDNVSGPILEYAKP